MNVQNEFDRISDNVAKMAIIFGLRADMDAMVNLALSNDISNDEMVTCIQSRIDQWTERFPNEEVPIEFINLLNDFKEIKL